MNDAAVDTSGVATWHSARSDLRAWTRCVAEEIDVEPRAYARALKHSKKSSRPGDGGTCPCITGGRRGS